MFGNHKCQEKYLKDKKHNSLHLVWKYAQIFCSWALSYPWSSQFPLNYTFRNSLLLGTDNIHRQISKHISAPNGDYCLYMCSIISKLNKEFPALWLVMRFLIWRYNVYVVVQFLPLVQNFLNQYKIFLNQFKFFEPVQNFQPKSICWFFCFCGKQKHLFGTFDLLFIPLLLFISTLLTSPTIPSLLSHISVPILFISMLTCTVWALNHLPLVFLWIHVLMPYHWAMETWMQVPLFF